MRVAILGAGFAGLSLANHLLHLSQGKVKIDLFDPLPIGQSVSGLSSGLLHAFAGKHAKKLWRADLGLAATHELITLASRNSGPLVLSKGILRPAVTDQQLEDFAKAAEHPETEWWSESTCKEKVPALSSRGGLFIKTGLTIDVDAYLQGLWQAAALLGTQFHQKSLVLESDFKGFDQVIFASGYGMKHFKPLSTLPLMPVKGQSIEIAWPSSIQPLPFSLVSQGYLVMSKDQKRALLGATFEREFQNEMPDMALAKSKVFAKITPFFPALESAEILSVKAGLRATVPTRSHMPLLGRITENQWFFTGLGSKGLLYHAYLGKILAQTILSKDLSLIPKEVLYSPFDGL